jgi:molecular chaperone GrpE
MTNAASDEEVEVPAAATDPEAEVVDAEIVEETDSSDQGGEVSEELSAEDEIAAAKAEAAEWQNKYLRLHAEWDTYRRRMKEQREEEKLRATEKLVEDIIPVLDDFERTINYATENGEEGLLGGVTAVHSKLNEVLVKEGVEVIDPVGQPYEALEAQAVATVDNPAVPDETVEQVYQKGYRMGNKVIRPAMVTVAVGGPKRETDEDDKNE